MCLPFCESPNIGGNFVRKKPAKTDRHPLHCMASLCGFNFLIRPLSIFCREVFFPFHLLSYVYLNFTNKFIFKIKYGHENLLHVRENVCALIFIKIPVNLLTRLKVFRRLIEDYLRNLLFKIFRNIKVIISNLSLPSATQRFCSITEM
jgi:hypothetical protein